MSQYPKGVIGRGTEETAEEAAIAEVLEDLPEVYVSARKIVRALEAKDMGSLNIDGSKPAVDSAPNDER